MDVIKNGYENKILQGDAIKMLKQIPDKSINMVMTSPPYWALRDYGSEVETIWEGDAEFQDCEHEWEVDNVREFSFNQNETAIKRPSMDLKSTGKKESNICLKCGAWKGQLGLEPTFDLYIKHLADIFDGVKRVLRDDGTIWVNLGDSYGSGKGEEGKEKQIKSLEHKKSIKGFEKCLLGIPMRFALEMINRGWILRNVIIWHKSNCMPSSVTDRFTVDFEYLFFFSKKKKYYFETQLEPQKEVSIQRAKYQAFNRSKKMDGTHAGMNLNNFNKHLEKISKEKNPMRNKRTVWNINPRPFSEAHFAVYPEELCYTPIKAGCSEGGIVLDMFFGSGTTGVVALKQGKKFVGIELNPEYIEIAKRRLKPYLEQRKLF